MFNLPRVLNHREEGYVRLLRVPLVKLFELAIRYIAVVFMTQEVFFGESLEVDQI